MYQEIQFKFSAQHDCRNAKCTAVASRPQVQERQSTAQTDKSIKHSEDSIFIVNTFALHNATLLRKALPRTLTKPTPLHEDRKVFHFSLATQLRISQAEKRAETQKKRKATLAAKQAKKRKRDVDMEEGNGIESEDYIGSDNEEHVANRARLDISIHHSS